MTPETTPPRVVLSDANVLFSRVLRDYLLYAADEQLITITWSEENLGPNTVKWHIGNMLDKTGTRDRTQLALWAVRHGLRP